MGISKYENKCINYTKQYLARLYSHFECKGILTLSNTFLLRKSPTEENFTIRWSERANIEKRSFLFRPHFWGHKSHRDNFWNSYLIWWESMVDPDNFLYRKFVDPRGGSEFLSGTWIQNQDCTAHYCPHQVCNIYISHWSLVIECFFQRWKNFVM